MITVLVNETGEFNEKNELVRIIGHLIDITDRRRVQEEIKKLNAELEQRVIERTIDLQQTNRNWKHFHIPFLMTSGHP